MNRRTFSKLLLSIGLVLPFASKATKVKASVKESQKLCPPYKSTTFYFGSLFPDNAENGSLFVNNNTIQSFIFTGDGWKMICEGNARFKI